jgi:outer membrane protein
MRLTLSFLAAACCLWGQAPLHLNLTQAQQQAVQNNPRISVAKLNAAAAYQQVPVYRAAMAPTLSAAITAVGADNGSRLAAGGLNNPVVYSRVGTGLIASQLLTDFGRTSNLVAMARLQAQAQDQAAEATRADIVLAASTAYFAVLRARSVLQVADQTVAARQLVANQITALQQSQLRSTLDVSFANVNLQDAKLLQVQAQNEEKAAEAQLAQVLGLPPGATFELAEETVPGALPPTSDDLVKEAILNRPELKDLRLQENAAERFARAEHDLYYPTVGALGATGLVPAGVANVPQRYGAVGVNVNIPIFNGGLFKARQTEAELRAQAAAKNITDEENRVMRDVRVTYLNATTAFQRIGLTQQLVDQATQSLQLAQSRFQLGLGSIVELSQAQLNLTSAQIAYAGARYDYESQRIAVAYQAGVLR